MHKRILLLTLGTGKNLEKAEKDAGYVETQYMINGEEFKKNGEPVKTNFVAEPIIDYYEPDIIIILGTVKSVWHSLYASFSTRNNEDNSYLGNENYMKLVEIEKNNDRNTTTEKLDSLSNEITSIFAKMEFKNTCFEKYKDKEKKPEIKVLLTKYGIDKDELKENYNRLKSVENYMDTNDSYEVAFDITHSFRSLPLYNLIIFNYIKNITKYKMSIKHIFYGNIDVKHEMQNETAPIVDLADLGEVLDLTSGVAEFKNTGCATTLLNLMKKEDELKEKLERFDIATQLNDFGEISDIICELFQIVQKEADEAKYTGIREMIKTVLEEKFFEYKEMDFNKNNFKTDLKFMLTKWFFSQNRMGLGLATGLEALRDINTPIFMKANNHDAKEERQFRENAEKCFIDIAEKLSEEEEKRTLNDVEKTCKNLGTKLRAYKQIRDVFAHSLERKNELGLDDILIKVKQFQKDLDNLKRIYDSERQEYEKLFEKNGGGTPKQRNNSKNCRIIIEFGQDDCIEGIRDSASKQKGDIYLLEKSVRNYLFGEMNNKNYKTEIKASLLKDYLCRNKPENYSIIQLNLHHCEDKEKEIIFKVFLQQLEEYGFVICDDEGKLTKKIRLQPMEFSTNYEKDLKRAISAPELTKSLKKYHAK